MQSRGGFPKVLDASLALDFEFVKRVRDLNWLLHYQDFMSGEKIITGTNEKYSGGEKERKETSGCKTRQQTQLPSGDARWVLTISEQTRTRCLWCQMQGLHITSGPLTSRLQGQREQRQHAELCMACECNGNNLLGVCFSATVQLWFIVIHSNT